MATEYEKTYHYVIDDFSGGLDLSSTRQGVNPKAARDMTDFYTTPDGAMVPRFGMIPMAVASFVDAPNPGEYPLWNGTYNYEPPKTFYDFGPYIHVLEDNGTTEIITTFRYRTGGDGVWYSWQMWRDEGLGFREVYGDGFGTYGSQYNTSVFAVMSNTYDETGYVDTLAGLDLNPLLASGQPYLSGVYQWFNGYGYFIERNEEGTMVKKAVGDPGFTPVVTVPATASLWGDIGTYRSAQDMAVWKERMFVLDSNKRMFFSAILDPTTWDTVDYLDFGGWDDGEAVGVMALGERLIVATTRAKYVVQGDTPNDWFIRAIEGHGVKAQGMFVTPAEPARPLWCSDGRGSLYYIGDSNKLYMWDGYHEYEMSKGLDPTTFQNPMAIAYHDNKVYVSTGKEKSYQDGV